MLFLLLCFTNGVFTPVQAQYGHPEALFPWQKELVERYSQARKQTLRLARQHNWVLRKNYSSQRVLQLQEIDPLGQPIYYTLHNAEAARGTRTLALQGGGSIPFTLSGNSPLMAGRLGIWDGGRVLESHQEFARSAPDKPRIVQKDNALPLNNHTTHLAGTLVGKGVNQQARGMAYGAQLSVWDYTDDVAELAVAAPGLLVSNHAYGPVAGWVYNEARPGTNPDLKWEWWGNPAISPVEDYRFGFYSTTTQDLDRLGYNNPFFLMVRSADNKRTETGPPAGTAYFLKNSGTKSALLRSRNADYDVIPADATAKNVLTIGAAEVSYTQNQPVLVGSTAYSGWGPTDDGRIKPDLLGIGSDVLSSIATDNTAYGVYTGTSMASANVSGSLFLLQELYASQRATGLPQTGQFMRAATLKGLALHTADRPNPAAGPDYRHGWGLLNTEAAARLLLNENQAHLILEQSLPAGKTVTRSVTAQGGEPLVITLSWTDPEGAATPIGSGALNNRTPKLVNDLDLRLSDGARTIFPFALDPAYPVRAAVQQDNFRDNIEQIYLPDPVPGKTYTITISHKGTMQYASQPFSVIVSGLKRTNCQLAVAIQPSKDTLICAGTVVALHSSATSATLRYQWLHDGAVDMATTTPVYQATKAGAYVLRITDKNGCSATSQPVQVKTLSLDLKPTGNQWLCHPDDAVPLEAVLMSGIIIPGSTIPGVTFSWLQNNVVINQANASTYRVTQAGSYRARVIYKGCQALSDEKMIRVTSVNNLDLIPTGTELRLPQGAALTLKAPEDTSYQYQWFRNNDSLPDARTYQLRVVSAGTYKVRVTQHGCTGWSAGRVVETAVLTATNSTPDGLFLMYPNPAETTLYVRYATPLVRQVQARILDLHGRIWHPAVSLPAQGGEIQGLVIQQLPPGIYILQIMDRSTTQTARFVKK